MKNSFIITLILGSAFVFQACSDDDFPVPPASTVPMFTYSIDNEEFAPATVAFTNASIVPGNVGEATYYWNFGNGESSTEASPSYVYAEAGAYDVHLVVTTTVSLEIREITKTIVVKDPNASGVPIYFTNGTEVYQGLINTQQPIFIPLNGIAAQSAYGMALDTVNSKIYISDLDAGKILKADLDGSNLEDFRTGLDSPIGMTIDYEENKIYWTTGSGIQNADMASEDINQKADFVTGQANDPEGVAINAATRKLYWVNYNGGLWSKNLDGTGEKLIIPDVEGGSILVINDRIYYDEYVASGDIRLKSAALDGTGVSTLAVGIGRVIYGIAYDASEEKIYWGDRGTDTMMRADLNGSNAEAWYVATADTRGIIIGNK